MGMRQMEYMLALAAHKNISSAAAACFISQSALSQSLTRLEQSLDVRLFERNHNVWTPTEAGELYLATAATIIAAHNRMLLEIGNIRKGTGTIRLGLSFERSSKLFPRIYLNFKNEYPDVALQLIEENYYKLQRMLLHGEIDLALSILPLNEQEEERRLLKRESRTIKEDLVLIVPRGHAFARRYCADPRDIPGIEELGREKFIHHPKNKVLRRILDIVFPSASLGKYLEVKSTTSIVEFVGKGIGISIVPKIFTLGNEGIFVIPLPPAVCWEFGVLYRKGRKLSAAERRLASLILDEFSGPRQADAGEKRRHGSASRAKDE